VKQGTTATFRQNPPHPRLEAAQSGNKSPNSMATYLHKRGDIVPRKIQRTSHGKIYDGYTLTGLTKNGHRWRPFFRTLKAAQEEAARLRAQQRNFGRSGMELPLAIRVEAAKCTERLEKYGIGLTELVDQFEAQKEKEARIGASRPSKDCLGDFLDSKERRANEYSPETLRNVGCRVRRLRAAWGERPIAGITLRDVSIFLETLKVGPQTRAHYRGLISEFFNYALRMEWVTSNPATALGRNLDRKKAKGREPGILTISEARELLEEAAADRQAAVLVPYLVAGLFLGLRPYEARRLRWEQVDFGLRSVEVLAETSKTRSGRHVEMNETALAWLQPYRRAEGLICFCDFRRGFDRVRRECGWKARVPKTKTPPENIGRGWEADVLRHSYASYWLAIHQNRPKLAELMGNSATVIGKHYRKPMPPRDAEGYWALRPKTASSLKSESRYLKVPGSNPGGPMN